MFNNKRTWRLTASVAAFAALAAAGYYLTMRGRYGWTLFVMLPSLAGGLGAWIFQPPTAGRTVKLGVIIGVIECAFFLVLGVEGLICVAMAVPILVPLTIGGALLVYWGQRRSTVACLLLPATLFFDATAKPPVYSVTTSMVVNAAPQRVWKYVVAFPDITDQPDWLLRTGVAYPIRTRIAGAGVGVARDCDLSTGTVKERVAIWNEPRLLKFIVTATPPAMKEAGLYGELHPKHLNGYYIGKQGQFELTPLAGGRTLVTGTSWYQHGLWPAGYWRWWSDTVVHHVHRRVLEHIRLLSERRP